MERRSEVRVTVDLWLNTQGTKPNLREKEGCLNQYCALSAMAAFPVKFDFTESLSVKSDAHQV